MSKKFVYLFKEGDATMRNLLGGKGANLAEMTRIGLPVPQGFTISTEACTQYYDDGKEISDEILEQIYAALPRRKPLAWQKIGELKTRSSFPFVPVLENPCPAWWTPY